MSVQGREEHPAGDAGVESGPVVPEASSSASALLVLAAHELLYRLGRPNLLHEACRITCDVLAADVVVALVNPDEGRTLVTKTQYGLSEGEWASYQMVEFDESIADAIRNRLVGVDISTLDVSEPHPQTADDSRRSIARKLGIGPMLLIALRPGGVLCGVLIACRHVSKGGFDDRARDVATGLAPLLGASLENQRLFDHLEAANRSQAAFLASMSHELRTPLHVITGYVDMLLDGDAGPLEPEQRTLCERIKASALRQLTLVGETFEMSRRDATGNVSVRREPFSLRALLAEIEHEIASHPLPSGVRLVLRAPESDVHIVSDPVKLGMILRNLVQNAIRFTPRGDVTVELQVDGPTLVCVVSDTGIGIAEPDREHIFAAFGQVDARASSGLGLGLYIVRRLLAALDGSITLESRLGEGSAFTVRIPLDPPSPAPSEPGAGSRA